MKTNIKLRVTPEQSEAVQKIGFANSIQWLDDNTNIPKCLEATYLFIESNRIWCRGSCSHNQGFETQGYTEIDADLFIRTNGNCEESIDIVDNLSNNKSKEDMFKQYGFEVPDFECEIFKYFKNDNTLVGYYKVKDGTVYAETWNSLNGRADNRENKYNMKVDLTPIKQPWYETCKFPVLVWDGDNDLFVIRTRGEYTASYLELCKPLTNAEIDQLKQDF